MTRILKSAFRSRNDVDAGIEPHGLDRSPSHRAGPNNNTVVLPP